MLFDEKSLVFILQPKEETEAVENDTDNTDSLSAKKAKLEETEVCSGKTWSFGLLYGSMGIGLYDVCVVCMELYVAIK